MNPKLLRSRTPGMAMGVEPIPIEQYLGYFRVMTSPRLHPHLGHVDDDELERLAKTWRAQALRGDREANGIAHA
ncbi:MAG: hypothetical protein EOO23_00550, partial [Comamonadaceae bacterium]